MRTSVSCIICSPYSAHNEFGRGAKVQPMSSGRRDGAIKRLRRTLVGGPRAPSTAQSKSAFADLDHFYEWPNPRYSEVRLARSPSPALGWRKVLPDQRKLESEHRG